MAVNLVRAGHEVTVFNRTAAKARPLIEVGAHMASSPAEAVANCEIMLTMLSDDGAVQEMLRTPLGAQRPALDSLPRGAMHISTSTISVALSRELSGEHARREQAYVASTVLGRPEAAAERKLWVIAAGKQADIERARPLLEALGRGISVVGDQPWQANLVKIAANFTLASVLETIGEAFALVRKAGMDPHQFLEVLNSTFNSPVYANYGRRIADRQFEPAGFRLQLGLKDISLALESGKDLYVPLPLASLIRDHYLSAIAHGRENEDWSAVAEVAAENASAK
jgi:3-hydroxyisobutyrate dehydrogenase-like beta-hydroxyacid dehydrogenase